MHINQYNTGIISAGSLEANFQQLIALLLLSLIVADLVI